MNNKHLHFKAFLRRKGFKISFILLGILSTLWFLIRVIPKPSRANYPCMRAAFPFMSAFIIYLLSISGSIIAFRKALFNFQKKNYYITAVLGIVSLSLLFLFVIQESNLFRAKAEIINPSDAPNTPIGTPMGINPGRVVWSWDTSATKNNFRSGTYFFSPENNNYIIYQKMLRESILKLTEKPNLEDAWDALFKYFNKKKKGEEVGYKEGEIIFLKINQGTISWTCSESTGWDFTKSNNKKNAGACQGNPYTILAMLNQLIDSLGIPQQNIYVGDPISHIMKQHFDLWKSYYPNVKYADKSSTSVSKWGRTKINISEEPCIFYSDKGAVMTDAVSDKIYAEMQNANYMINIANLKAHVRAGITLCTKNHFGSHSRDGAWHLHASLVSPQTESNPTNNQYKQYRVFVDIMGSKYLGQNTMLFVVDGIYGGDYHELYPPRRWNMPPFNGDWCNSLFVSQDQVALESVCFDFLRTEYNGTNNSNTNPNWGAVDDYLHQAASSTEWPEGIIYDPDNSGTPLGSLGVHEHWNNAIDKKYSRNLGDNSGIELILLNNEPFDTSAYQENPNKVNKVNLIRGFTLYPNPVSDLLTLTFMNSTHSNCTISLITSEGKLIYNKKITQLAEGFQQIQLNVGNIPSGLYLCQLKLNNSTLSDNKVIRFYKK